MNDIKTFLIRRPLPSRQDIGVRGESDALAYLLKKGWTLLDKNYRTRLGEIDLIFGQPDGTIVFVEVKYRSRSDFGQSSEMVNISKQRKIVKAALSYIKEKGLKNNTFRFDVAALSPSGVLHIPNAFQSPGGYTY